MPFSTVFQLYCGGQCTYPCFPGVVLTSTPHNILSKPLAAFPHNHCRNNGRGERGMNPVSMPIVNPRKEYWPIRGLNPQPPVLKSTMLPTELWDSAAAGTKKLYFYSIIVLIHVLKLQIYHNFCNFDFYPTLTLYSINAHFDASMKESF